MKVNLLSLITVTVLVPGCIFAQTDFFWSLRDQNMGAVNADVSIELGRGSSGTLFLYYSTNGPTNSDIDTAASVDISTSQSGVIRFTGAETFNFDITALGMPVLSRWEFFGATATVSDDLIDELNAFRIFNGVGILEANNGSGNMVDVGFDEQADAFLFARVDFEVLPGQDATEVEIMLSEGSGGIVNDGMRINPTFGTAAVVVTEPEPTIGDLNGDGVVDEDDINPFVQAIVRGQYLDVADINRDGSVNLFDVRPFIQLF